MSPRRRMADAVESLALALVHPSERERYREEWQADLDGAHEAGVDQLSLALGALRFGLAARVTEPSRLGLPPDQRSIRLIRWALVPVFLAPLLGAVAFTAGLLVFVGWQVLFAAVALWLLGVALLASALRVGGRSLWWAGLALAPLLLMISPFGSMLLAPVVIVGAGVGLGLFIAWANRVSGVPAAAPAPLGRRLGAAVVALVLVLSTIAVGLADGLIWMPLAITEDAYGLSEIYSIVGTGVTVPLIVWAGIGLALGIGVVAISAVPAEGFARALQPKRVVLLGFVLAGLGMIAAPWAAFSIGMEISDLIPPMAGGGSEITPFLSLSGGLALVVALMGSLPPGRTRTVRVEARPAG